ncbi:MAG TPA: ATP-binding protein [Thermoanaerobaculia bacterium]|nr:ATP-binding protein [Thermoanaerobaculia bacterium]
MSLPIRARLTIWYSVVLSIVLLAFAAGVYFFVAAEERANVDRILRERVESFASAYANERLEEDEMPAVREIGQQFSSEGDVFIYDGRGNVVFRAPGRLLRQPPPLPPIGLFTRDGARCIAARVGPFVMVSAESLEGRRHAVERLLNAFAILIPLAIVLAAFAGYFLAGRSLRPLNAALQALERSVQQQKQLLADTSHELRTPAAIIRSEAEVTLSRERDAGDYRRALDAIRSESEHLSSLLDGVMLLARADAQQEPLQKTPLQLEAVIQDAVQSMKNVAQSRGVDLTCATDGEMPMRGNSELLRRMLLNLLSNAIKFTDSGGRVHLAARSDGPAYVVTVTDSGGGIPPEAQPKIFDRFFRADQARSRDLDRLGGGAGLGLPIARWIAQTHGGDVRLMQSSAAGSVFEAVLPVSESGA